ncbi:MAG: esterase [Deltaproteobacteria bacterium]|nr:esterase [Deltaproteobacteria bacterium]MBN2671580.1 esterase [Deltaproteobacteria bacterium]
MKTKCKNALRQFSFPLVTLMLIAISCSPKDKSNAPRPKARMAKPAQTSEPRPVSAAVEGSTVDTREWHFDQTAMGPIHVIATVPNDASDTRKMPVLIALHGQGESRKTPVMGARGWPFDYGMVQAMNRLAHPPLTTDDFGDMVTPERLQTLNRSLAERPYRGIIVVSPYLPDEFRSKRLLQDAEAYGAFITDQLLPKVFAETPAFTDPAHIGIDGVSLGGRASISIGLSHPKVFGAVGGTQAAFGVGQAPMIVGWLKEARRTSPALRFRIISSVKDKFKDFTEALSSQLDQANLSHQMDIVQGNHSYEFNRGPGVYEMLLYYDRTLRNEPFLGTDLKN